MIYPEFEVGILKSSVCPFYVFHRSHTRIQIGGSTMTKKNILLEIKSILIRMVSISSKIGPSTGTLKCSKSLIIEGVIVDREGNYFLIRMDSIPKQLTSNIYFYNNCNEIVIHSENAFVKLGDKVRVKGFINEETIAPSMKNANVERVANF